MPLEQQPEQGVLEAVTQPTVGVHVQASAVVVVAGVMVVVVTEEMQVDEAMVEQVYTWVANIHLYSTVQYSTVQYRTPGWRTCTLPCTWRHKPGQHTWRSTAAGLEARTE